MSKSKISLKKPKFKTEWNLKLLYKSPTDPQIEKDTITIEKAYKNFTAKYTKATSYLNNTKKLKEALDDWEKLSLVAGTWKPVLYFYYLKDIDSDNPLAGSKMNLLINRLTKSANSILFFNIKLGKIIKQKQKVFLKDSKLKKYRYYLKLIFDTAKYDLTEAEEKILNLESLPARQMWKDGNEKLLNSQLIKYQGKNLPLSQAMSLIPEAKTVDRRILHRMVTEKLKSISHFAEAEINAIYTHKKISDELRGFKNPWEATILSYQNNQKTILNLVKMVTKYFSVSQKYYKLSSILLKQKFLTYADRQAQIGKMSQKFPFESGINLTFKAFEKVDKKYSNILRDFLKNGQIDIFPRKGKTGGAHCSSSFIYPSFVLMNYTNGFSSVMTIAHEMGHAFHSELSKLQPILYQDYTTSVAEVASTLFENFAFAELFEKLSDKEKIIALHDRLNDDISTIFRQIACFNFETELHQLIRGKGSLSKEEIASIHNKHMSAYLGPSVKMEENDGYLFVWWSHIRNFFYVYSYAFGQLISKALYKRYQKDKNFIKQIEKFLSAGGSKSPEDIFKDIGIDISKPSFFEEGLKSIEEDIKQLEKLAKRAKLI